METQPGVTFEQLGDVYQAVLSWAGFYVDEEVYEVRSADKKIPGSHYCRASDIGRYRKDEIASGPFQQGTFLYRHAAPDRRDGQSFFTPKVLAECLVKYSLKELLRDELRADEILKLTILEPTVGSGGLLVEAISQLAHAYLKRKQEEIGRTIPEDTYAYEHRRVMKHIANRNSFAVDINPMSIIMTRIVLWLYTVMPQTLERGAA